VGNIEGFLSGFRPERFVLTGLDGIPAVTEVLSRKLTARSVALHPFQIEVTETDGALRLYVNFGAVSAMVWKDGKASPVSVDVPLHFTGNKRLLNDPWHDDEVGYHSISKGKTYGVWLSLTGAIQYITPSGSSTNSVLQLSLDGANSGIQISTTATKPSDYLVHHDGVVGRFIGSVTVDSDGQVQIKQHLRSDIDIQLADVYSTF
jgi:hypothetical protein